MLYSGHKFAGYSFYVFVNFFSDSSSTIDLLIEYFKRFGDKPCCFWDLEPYLYLNLQETSAREKVMGCSWDTCSSRHLQCSLTQ